VFKLRQPLHDLVLLANPALIFDTPAHTVEGLYKYGAYALV
jgi:hypothetical protein